MDLVVTCPGGFFREWVAEGDPAGTPESGEEWGWFMGGPRPPIGAGDRLYVVACGRLRGYAPVTRLAHAGGELIDGKLPAGGKWVICRQGGAVAVTIPQVIRGFQGYRKVWWKREEEIPFPDWQTP